MEPSWTVRRHRLTIYVPSWTELPAAEGARRLSVLEQPRPVADIRLTDMRGQVLTLADVDGRAAIVEFIYATCPTICVALGESFAKLRDDIKAAAPFIAGHCTTTERFLALLR